MRQKGPCRDLAGSDHVEGVDDVRETDEGRRVAKFISGDGASVVEAARVEESASSEGSLSIDPGDVLAQVVGEGNCQVLERNHLVFSVGQIEQRFGESELVRRDVPPEEHDAAPVFPIRLCRPGELELRRDGHARHSARRIGQHQWAGGTAVATAVATAITPRTSQDRSAQVGGRLPSEPHPARSRGGGHAVWEIATK